MEGPFDQDPLSTERFRRIREVFEMAVEHPREEREAFLEQACRGDDALRQEVLRMLEQNSTLTLVDQPAWRAFSELLDEEAGPAIGAQLGPYRIEGVLGTGGMGRVYKATDTRLSRLVALKISRRQFGRQFGREARVIAALNHPHICAIYDVGPDYLVMEFVARTTLAEKIERGPLPWKEALRVGCEMADALAYAHSKGIRHGDLKPGNVMVDDAGRVKVLDFGLATLLAQDPEDVTPGSKPPAGTFAGTVAYASPEQAEGKTVDARSDIFSFGVVLYEMLCGRNPFQRETPRQTIEAIPREVPVPPRRIQSKIPRALETIVMRCLEKQPDARYRSVSELHSDLEALQTRLGSRMQRIKIATIAAVFTIATFGGVLATRSYIHTSRVRWAEQKALPEIARLAGNNRLRAALQLFHQASPYLPPSRDLVALTENLYVLPVSIETTPPGAEVYISDYGDLEGSDAPHWQSLGRSPLRTQEIPYRGFYRIRVSQTGFEPVERAFTPAGPATLRVVLHSSRETPARMVWIPAAGAGAYLSPGPTVALGEFWLDKYEVTNGEFKRFVDAGGYRRREFWKQSFVKDGQPIPWEQAMAEFRDSTGMAGAATWRDGTFPTGQADYPVGGVSWYEAAAYAEFAGKSLPTVYHWYRGAGIGLFSDILRFSNFSGEGPAPVGKNRGLAGFGSYDMAGNMKEWCLNPAGQLRYILGGGWDEDSNEYVYPDARNPFDREATFGFRCARYQSPIEASLMGPVKFVDRDRRHDAAADKRAFEIYKDFHSYEKTDLNAVVESSDDSSPYFRQERVSFQAAYLNERVIAHLFLPKNAAPPYQVVAFFGGGNMYAWRSIRDLKDPYEFVIRSGRAVIIPAYKGTLERGGSAPDSRDNLLAWSKDLGRSIDYLETRPDIDVRKFAFYGMSEGAAHGVRLVAVEPRIKTAVLVSGGSPYKRAGEVDPWNFAPWVKIPVLMINGRNDFTFPLETNTLPLFHALGTPEKRQILFEGGHVNLLTRMETMNDVVDWLDQHLGPVTPR